MYCAEQKRDSSNSSLAFKPRVGAKPTENTHLQVVVVAAEVSGGLVLVEQGVQIVQEALGGPVFRHGPHGVVAGHQQEVGRGLGQPLLQPDQLALGLHRIERPAGHLAQEVVALAAQRDCVQHDDGQRHVGDSETQLVIEIWKLPGGGEG